MFALALTATATQVLVFAGHESRQMVDNSIAGWKLVWAVAAAAAVAAELATACCVAWMLMGVC